MTLRGGYSSYSCYKNGSMGGCNIFCGYINTASCDMALEICVALGGGCVEGGDC